jgi:hypothetical protein
MKGFVPKVTNSNDSKCVPTGPGTCPFGDPPQGQTECQVYRDTSGYTDNVVSHTCPGADSFCMVPATESTFPVNVTGFCCALPKPSCPIGSPRPRENLSGECPVRTFELDGGFGGKRPIPCELDGTHYCSFEAVSALRVPVGCCPRACPAGYKEQDGRCYPLRGYGEPCEVDEQCQRVDDIIGLDQDLDREFSNQQCIEGTCACAVGAHRALQDHRCYPDESLEDGQQGSQDPNKPPRSPGPLQLSGLMPVKVV